MGIGEAINVSWKWLAVALFSVVCGVAAYAHTDMAARVDAAARQGNENSAEITGLSAKVDALMNLAVRLDGKVDELMKRR